jgi:hypothetical protein
MSKETKSDLFDVANKLDGAASAAKAVLGDKARVAVFAFVKVSDHVVVLGPTLGEQSRQMLMQMLIGMLSSAPQDAYDDASGMKNTLH